MKTLTVLILAQIGILFVLFGKIVAVEKRMPVVENMNNETPLGDVVNIVPADGYSSESYSFPNENQLRNIIREELQAHMIVKTGSDHQDDAAMASDSEYTAENQYQLDLVSRKLDYFESVGTTTEMEMQDIQVEIAKLHPADRNRMLNRLIRSMNAGDIDGRL